MADDEPEFAFHRLADIFPMMDEAALAELAADIKTHGLRESIKLWEARFSTAATAIWLARWPGSSRWSRRSNFATASHRRSPLC